MERERVMECEREGAGLACRQDGAGVLPEGRGGQRHRGPRQGLHEAPQVPPLPHRPLAPEAHQHVVELVGAHLGQEGPLRQVAHPVLVLAAGEVDVEGGEDLWVWVRGRERACM